MNYRIIATLWSTISAWITSGPRCVSVLRRILFSEACFNTPETFNITGFKYTGKHMATITQHIVRPLTAILLCWPMLATAADNTVIEYSPSTDTLTLKANDVYLDDALDKISNKLGFKVYRQDTNLHRKVTAEIKGSAATVLIKLLKPDSVALTISDHPAGKITSLTVLPVGEKSDQLPTTQPSLSPHLTGDPAEDARKIRLQERRMMRRSQGSGRKNE